MQNLHEKKTFKNSNKVLPSIFKSWEDDDEAAWENTHTVPENRNLEETRQRRKWKQGGKAQPGILLCSGSTVAGAFLGCPWLCGEAGLHAHHPSLSHHSFPEDMLQSIPYDLRQTWGLRSIAVSRSDSPFQPNEKQTYFKIQICCHS